LEQHKIPRTTYSLVRVPSSSSQPSRQILDFYVGHHASRQPIKHLILDQQQ
jgi:hypothetical protein